MPSDVPGLPSPPPPPQHPPTGGYLPPSASPLPGGYPTSPYPQSPYPSYPPGYRPQAYGPPAAPAPGRGDERAPELDGVARRTSPLTVAVNLVGVAVFLLVLLPQLLVPTESTGTSNDASGPVVLILFVVFAGITSAVNIIGWFSRTYTVGEKEMVIDEGVLRRRRKVVPYARVQQVDIKQQLLQQALNLAQLRIDTAGESAGSVKLGLLDAKLARGMRRHILTRRAELQAAASAPTASAGAASGGRPAGAPPPPTAFAAPHAPPVTLLQLDTGRLILAAVTHHTIVAGLPLLALVGLWFAGLMALTNEPTTGAAIGASVAVVTFVAFAFMATFVGRSAIDQHGFTLSEEGDDLHLRYGLFEVQNLTVPRRRVQHITIEDNPIRRALGIAAIHLHSAAPLTADREGRTTRFEIPIMKRADLDPFLHALMGGSWHVPQLTPRSDTAKRRAVTRRVAALALAMAFPAFVAPPGSFLLLLLAGLGVPWGLAAHRRAGFAETPELLVLAHGVFVHHTDLLPFSRVQSCATDQTPFQRWAGVRTLHVNVAGPSSDPRLYDMPDAAAIAYAREVPRKSVTVAPS